MNLNIDPEFKGLIPPLTKEEYTHLEQLIVTEGCRDALVVWDGTLVDGHNRYQICTEHNIPFKTEAKHFDTRENAIAWIIQTQFGRRNLSPGNRAILALRLEPIIRQELKKKQEAGINQYSLPQNSAEPSCQMETRKELAKIAGVSHDTVDKVKLVVNNGTPEQVERIKEGGKGNSVHAVYNEVRQAKPSTPKTTPSEPKPRTMSLAEANAIVADIDARIAARGPVEKTETPMCLLSASEALRRHKAETGMKGMPNDASVSITLFASAEAKRTTPHIERLAQMIGQQTSHYTLNLRTLLSGHSTTLLTVDQPENRQKIIAALSEAEAAITKMKGLLS